VVELHFRLTVELHDASVLLAAAAAAVVLPGHQLWTGNGNSGRPLTEHAPSLDPHAAGVPVGWVSPDVATSAGPGPGAPALALEVVDVIRIARVLERGLEGEGPPNLGIRRAATLRTPAEELSTPLSTVKSGDPSRT